MGWLIANQNIFMVSFTVLTVNMKKVSLPSGI